MATKKRLISLDEAIAKVKDDGILGEGYSDDERIDDVCDILESCEIVDAVEVVHGRWIDMQEDEATDGMWRCSVCGSDRYFDVMTPIECGCYYCPNCGADMRERKDNG